MLDEMQALGLLGLIVCQYLLIRGCFGIKDGLDANGGSITAKIDRTADLLDEVAQLISDLADGVGAGEVHSPVAHMPTGPMDLLTAFLNNRMSMAQADSHAEKEQEWEVLPPNNDPTPTQEPTA